MRLCATLLPLARLIGNHQPGYSHRKRRRLRYDSSGGTCSQGGQPPNELNLFGGLAVDPATNQAFVVQSGSSTIQIVDLGPTSSTKLKTVEITELQVPTVLARSLAESPVL